MTKPSFLLSVCLLALFAVHKVDGKDLPNLRDEIEKNDKFDELYKCLTRAQMRKEIEDLEDVTFLAPSDAVS